jgi:myosin heavy subunit
LNFHANRIIVKSQSNHSLSSSSSSSHSSLNSINQDDNDMSNVWLLHANGYSQAKIFAKVIQKLTASTNTDTKDSESYGSGFGNQIRYKVRLENGSLIEVNEEYLEKANPSPQYDFCEDLSHLRFINESSLIHCLRQRYITLRLVHTRLNSQSLICMRPAGIRAESNDTYRHMYSDKLVSMFKGCKQEDMPPHVYAYAQSVYRNMLTSRQDQSILMMGHSGSGKTQNVKHVLNYLFKVSNSNSNIFTGK